MHDLLNSGRHEAHDLLNLGRRQLEVVAIAIAIAMGAREASPVMLLQVDSQQDALLAVAAGALDRQPQAALVEGRVLAEQRVAGRWRLLLVATRAVTIAVTIAVAVAVAVTIAVVVPPLHSPSPLLVLLQLLPLPRALAQVSGAPPLLQQPVLWKLVHRAAPLRAELQHELLEVRGERRAADLQPAMFARDQLERAHRAVRLHQAVRAHGGTPEGAHVVGARTAVVAVHKPRGAV